MYINNFHLEVFYLFICFSLSTLYNLGQTLEYEYRYHKKKTATMNRHVLCIANELTEKKRTKPIHVTAARAT